MLLITHHHVTDIVGYTAMMRVSEQKAVLVIKHYNAALEKWLKNFNGQVLKLLWRWEPLHFPQRYRCS